MNKRVVGVIAGLAGIAALVYGLFSKEWVVGTDFGIETHVGLQSSKLCQNVVPEPGQGVYTCTSVSHSEIARSHSKPDGFDSFSLVALITFYTGLGCAALMLLVTGLALARLYPRAFATLGIVVTFATLILIAVTLAIHPWKKVGWGTGSGVMIAGGGATACLFAAILLGRLRPPVGDDW
jgi:hypothetical protein